MGISKIVEQILKITNESPYGRLDMDSSEAREILKLLNKELKQGQSLPIDSVIETSPKFPVLQDNSIEEKCCNNCKHNGNQMIYPSACTGCGADEEYNNHEYSR